MKHFRDQIYDIVKQLKSHIDHRPATAIVLGSGLGKLEGLIEVDDQISFAALTGMPVPSAPTHQGQFIFGRISGHPVVCCQGRLHLYEGFTAQQVALCVYICAELGVQRIIISNAAGALNAAFSPGELMLINDHINLTGCNPLVGQDDWQGSRFVDMSQPYDPMLCKISKEIASELNISLHSGRYVGVLGPSLETNGERLMMAASGGDAVGMSTVMEVIAARHCGLDVLGLSAICNMATGDESQQVDSIEAVLANAQRANEKLLPLISELCRRL